MKKIAGLLLSLFLILNLSAQEIIYVNKSANGKNKGISWSDAFNDLQSAFQQVKAGGEIWVVQGIYLPTTESNREATFQLKEKMQTEMSPQQELPGKGKPETKRIQALKKQQEWQPKQMLKY